MPMLASGISASIDTKNALTSPVNAVMASASPPGTAFGPKIVSSRSETATNSSPIRVPAAVAAAVK
jgi:hypothetical protein